MASGDLDEAFFVCFLLFGAATGAAFAGNFGLTFARRVCVCLMVACLDFGGS